MRCVSTVLAAALIALAVPAAAQDKPIDIGIGFGLTSPVSDSGTFGTATVFPFSVTYKINEKIGIQAGYGFHRFGSKTFAPNATQLPSNPDYISSIPLAANHQMHDFDGGVVFSAPDKGGVFRPYGLAGIGLYQEVVSLTSTGTGDVTVCAPALWICYPTAAPATEVLGERRYNNFGFNIGGGTTLKFGELARLFVEIRYIHTNGPTVRNLSGGTVKANGNYFPIVFGFKI